MKDSNNFNSFSAKELLFFNKLIVPNILTFFYWIVLIIDIGSGIFSLFNGSILGFIGALVGVVFIRIGFEMTFVGFSINRHLEKLVELQSSSRNQASTPE